MSGDRPAPGTTGSSPSAWPPPNRYGSRAVPLANDAKGIVARSIQALADLPEEMPPAAVVGGLAVMVRLYQAHRVTTDFDEVSARRDDAITTLLALGAVRTSNGVHLPGQDVQLDFLDAETDLATLATMATGPLEGPERGALQLAMVCRYALERAALTDIYAIDAASDQIVAQVTIPVAVAGALVAMKVHSARSPDRNPVKVASDLYDTYRLIRAWGPTVIAEDLSRAPVPMLEHTIEQLQFLFVEEVDRTAHRLASASVPGVSSVDVDDLEAIAVVAERLAPFTAWDRPVSPITQAEQDGGPSPTLTP